MHTGYGRRYAFFNHLVGRYKLIWHYRGGDASQSSGLSPQSQKGLDERGCIDICLLCNQARVKLCNQARVKDAFPGSFP
jgi:hypothetical protein